MKNVYVQLVQLEKTDWLELLLWWQNLSVI